MRAARRCPSVRRRGRESGKTAPEDRDEERHQSGSGQRPGGGVPSFRCGPLRVPGVIGKRGFAGVAQQRVFAAAIRGMLARRHAPYPEPADREHRPHRGQGPVRRMHAFRVDRDPPDADQHDRDAGNDERAAEGDRAEGRKPGLRAAPPGAASEPSRSAGRCFVAVRGHRPGPRGCMRALIRDPVHRRSPPPPRPRWPRTPPE